MLAAADPYGPLVDTYTGAVCPTPMRDGDIYDLSLYDDLDLMKLSPAVAARCLKMRQALLDKRARERRAEPRR